MYDAKIQQYYLDNNLVIQTAVVWRERFESQLEFSNIVIFLDGLYEHFPDHEGLE